MEIYVQGGSRDYVQGASLVGTQGACLQEVCRDVSEPDD